MKDMEYMGEWKNFQIYKNSDGFIECFRSIGRNMTRTNGGRGGLVGATDLKRVITNVRTISQLPSFFKKKPAIKDMSLKNPAQLKIF